MNFYLKHSLFVDGKTQEGCGRCSNSDLAISVAATLHPNINLKSLPSPPSLPTTTTTAIIKFTPRCRRRTFSPPSRSRFASLSLPHSPTSTSTYKNCKHIHPCSCSLRRLLAWMQRAVVDIHPSPQHLRGFANTL